MVQSLPYYRNVFRQLRSDAPKIFIIGYNKTGTTAIYRLLKASGIYCAHFRYSNWSLRPKIPFVRFDNKMHFYLAFEMEKYANEGKLKDYLRTFTCYSDMFFFTDNVEIEANHLFREFHEACPNAYFILNDRPLEAWVNSRAQHGNGTLLKRSMAYHECGEAEVKDIWRAKRDQFHEEVLAYFEGNERFLHFQLDSDPVSRIVDFLAADYAINPKYWLKQNITRA